MSPGCGWTRPPRSTPHPLWTPSAVPLLNLPPHKVLEPLESSSKLWWILVKVPPFFAPKTRKHFFFSFSSLEGGAEEVPDHLLFSPAPPWWWGVGVGAGPPWRPWSWPSVFHCGVSRTSSHFHAVLRCMRAGDASALRSDGPAERSGLG